MRVVCGIVGSAGTGKTALAQALVTRLGEAGLSVGYVKHTHQDFDLDRPGSDTARVTAAGAARVVGISPGRRFLLVSGVVDDPRLALEGLESCEVVLVEGYHRAAWPKIRVTRVGETRREAEPPVIAEIVSERDGRLPHHAPAVAFAAIEGLLARAEGLP
jgi:molybdopterin-guanine dinucleotide biosynthesis protein MobB